MNGLTSGGTRTRGPQHRVAILIAAVALVFTACSSPSVSTQQPSVPRTSSDAPKTLQLAFREDPPEIHGGASGTPEREVGEVLNAGLTFWEPSGNLAPKLAAKVPSVADGDWKVNPDGTMELTWKLKPNLKWHDGTAFTAEDMVFSINVLKDRDWPISIPSGVRLITDADAPDPQTLVIRYSRTDNTANVASSMELPPLPRHHLESAYTQGGAGAVGKSPVFSTEWVGLGPYRMTGRTLGSQIDAVAFDDYVLGRPKIDRLVIKATNDANALVARLLSSDVDMVPNNMEAVQAATLKQQWESQGRGTVVPKPTRIRQIQLNYRDPSAPWASDVRVRQGMLHLLDRQGLVESVLAGVSPVGHTALLPEDPAYARLEQIGLPKFPLDRPAGERLLDAAGWPRGPDGIRRNAAGTVFRYNQSNVGESDQDETLVLVDGFKAGGIDSAPDVIPETATNQAELRAKSNGVARPAVADSTYWERFHSSAAAAESNRWRLGNTGGYSNPEVDRMIDQWRATLEPAQILDRTVELHKYLLDNLVALPLYYQVEVFAYRKGLNGPGAFTPMGRNALVDIHTWTID